MPFVQANGTGRDHNIECFTCWLMGGGVEPGTAWLDRRGRLRERHRPLALEHTKLTFWYASTRRAADGRGMS